MEPTHDEPAAPRRDDGRGQSHHERGDRVSPWRPAGDGQVALVALATVGGVWAGWPRVGLVVAGVAVAMVLLDARAGLRRDGRSLWPLVAAAGALAAVGASAGERAWAEVASHRVGEYSGWALLVSDPAPAGRGVQAVLEVEGERFQVYAYGSPRRRLERRQAGEQVEVWGTRSPARPGDRWLQVRHVVGRFEAERVGAWTAGSPAARASNRLRARLRSAAERSMPAEDAALFTGLVVGDDARQSDEAIDRFRAVGLSHLTAVSGQNVAYVLAAAGVALRRLPRWWRLAATWGLIGWFVMLTRVEPSVVRAGAMAGIGALAVAVGHERSVARVLAVAVVVLVLVDPLLVWSVGFWLSCGATAGVAVLAPPLAVRWRGPTWLAMPMATTVGAQLGVLVPSVLVFGRLPVTGVVANLLAVPVAGVVMLVGMPAALVASVLPGIGATVAMTVPALGTRWVGTVAALAERLAPDGAPAAGAWLVQLGLAAWWWRPRRDGASSATPPV